MKTKQVGTHVLTVVDLVGPGSLEPLEIPERPGPDGKPGVVFIRPPTAGDVIDFSEQKEEVQKGVGMLRLLAASIVDGTGKRMFASEEEVAQLRAMDVRVFSRLSTAITNLSKVPGIDDKGPAGNVSAPVGGGALPTA